ncbi:hypothetical protein [Caryophanon tenue]|uniref:Aminodeoxychorismate lyase n=1 Tax=Caryophanon tenue TaxID=33978 RepID=A0A1C0YN42_9BACL|nr:hypothetical protein [Caryophanon tenue]OCS88587.1 hypothetical protein A6M13_01710 [Caryophanon tenue]
MNKHSVRSFGIATFLIGGLFYGAQTLNIALPGVTTIEQSTVAEKQVDALTAQLAEAQQTIDDLQSKQTADTSTEQPTVAAEDNEKTLYESKLIIYRGITSYDISKKLMDANIITNAIEFEMFLVNGGYHKRLQVGEYRLNSDMSYERIAEIITTP